jgi:hypothetical protein
MSEIIACNKNCADNDPQTIARMKMNTVMA